LGIFFRYFPEGKRNQSFTKVEASPFFCQEEIKPMNFAIYMNVDGLKANSNSIKSNMVEQLVSPVQFERTIRNMVQDGMTHFLEIGPGTVLQGLVKKIVPEVPVISFNELTEFDIMKGWLHQHGFIQ
jgi:[acyl-carrier-protein] S-malonyltransferase